MTHEEQLEVHRREAIAQFRRAAAATAELLKKKLLDEIPLDVHEALWLEKAASKFPGAVTPLQMCDALINRQAVALVTKRLKS